MMRISEAAQALGARVQGSDVAFSRVHTDTRTLKRGDLFVALRGERFDAHQFLAQARDSGAAAAMVDETGTQAAPAGFPLLIVPDTRLALGALAAHWRAPFRIPVVALTGSSGKTTVKEMLAAILRTAAGDAPSASEDRVLATRGNLNNDIGLPLMMLELAPVHRYAVLEMGMNHGGEIRYLTQIARPDVAVVTNAGRAHIEYLGSEEAIARAKGEIFEALSREGTAVINADDRFAPLWRELAGPARRVEFGLDHPAAVSATCELRELESDIVLRTPAGAARARIQAPGAHNVRNALAACAAAFALDVPLNVMASGLESYTGVKGRLQRKRGRRGAALIDDTYNANPESVRAAIAVLARVPGQRILVFGDMGELGRDAARLHAEIGTCAKDAGIDRVLTLGDHAAETARTAGSGARHYSRIEDLVADLEKVLAPAVTVLVKGSRFMKMERVVAALLSNEER
jgi:UDP-N-acetylmuramoyl-tripeptide--D-alanyl-D-alanine ligase